MKNAVKWILVLGWALLAGFVVFLLAIPKPSRLPPWFPDPRSIRVFIILLILISVICGLSQLYHAGLRRAGKK